MNKCINSWLSISCENWSKWIILSLGFLTCEMGIIVPITKGCWENEVSVSGVYQGPVTLRWGEDLLPWGVGWNSTSITHCSIASQSEVRTTFLQTIWDRARKGDFLALLQTY